MKIGNIEVKLYYSNLAVREINELCGGVAKISTLFTDENGNPVPYETEVNNIIKLILILANAGIKKDNWEKRNMISDGEEKPLLTFEDLEQIIDISKLSEYTKEIMEAMGLASKFEVPDGLKLTEPDIDLDEIEAEKNP
jgi:hypothetical protein